MSAAQGKNTLFVIQAADEYVSALDRKCATVDLSDSGMRQKISHMMLKHPNMNETGRLPGFCLFHIGMKMRLTQTTETGIAVTDSTGTVLGIEFDEREPQHHKNAATLPTCPLVVLRYMPTAIYFKLDVVEGVEAPEGQLIAHKICPLHEVSGFDAQCPQCFSCDNVVAVTPYTSIRPWCLDVKLGESHEARVKVRRTQFPLTCVKASTLHVLQGSTCDPGLIFHWKFPRRLDRDLVWLAAYVAISRVRKLEKIRSIGISKKIRHMIEAGPPDTIPATFAKYFAAKEKQTQKDADDYMRFLGWA